MDFMDELFAAAVGDATRIARQRWKDEERSCEEAAPKTYRAINIYNHEEAIFTVEGKGPEAVYVDSDGDRWCAQDFLRCWRTEGSRDYDSAVRYKRQKAEQGEASDASRGT